MLIFDFIGFDFLNSEKGKDTAKINLTLPQRRRDAELLKIKFLRLCVSAV